MTPTRTDDQLRSCYAEHRPALLAVAYRMLGSFADAEDVVQEAFLRFRAVLADGVEPESERAYLTTVTVRLAVDQLRSARVRRERYVGPWLPEPAVEGLTDLADEAALSDSLSTAFLVLLERLTPEQRAALLLRDVFGFGYDEIAGILSKSQSACRQLATRARRHVRDDDRVREVSPAEQARLAERFFEAAREGNIGELVAALAQDAEFVGDGGSSGRGLSRPVHGREQVAQLLKGLLGALVAAGVRMEHVRVGSQPSVVLLDGEDRLVAVWSLVLTDEGLVRAVHGMVNPEKLAHLGIPETTLSRRSRRER